MSCFWCFLEIWFQHVVVIVCSTACRQSFSRFVGVRSRIALTSSVTCRLVLGRGACCTFSAISSMFTYVYHIFPLLGACVFIFDVRCVCPSATGILIGDGCLVLTRFIPSAVFSQIKEQKAHQLDIRNLYTFIKTWDFPSIYQYCACLGFTYTV